MDDGAVPSLPPASAGASETHRAPRRLRRRKDFLAAAKGRRFHTERVTAQGRLRAAVETRDGAPASGLYVGLTVTKRVGHAPERNRIRRRLRRAVEIAALAVLPPEADIVLIARRAVLDAPFASLVDDVSRALRTLGQSKRSRPRTAEAADPTKSGRTDRAGDSVIAPGTPETPPSPATLPAKASRGTIDG